MIKRLLPWDGLGHEVVAHGGVLYIGGVIAEDTSLAWPAKPTTCCASSPNC